MPPSVNFQIGVHQFVDAQGRIPQPQPRIERIFRPGVAYARYRDIGDGGREPFTILTSVNVADIADGRATMTLYQALVGGDIRQFIWADYDFDTNTPPFRVAVLSVEQESLTTVVQWCNSFDDNDKARLRAIWTLEFRPI